MKAVDWYVGLKNLNIKLMMKLRDLLFSTYKIIKKTGLIIFRIFYDFCYHLPWFIFILAILTIALFAKYFNEDTEMEIPDSLEQPESSK